MITLSSGINAYSTTDQISRPPVENQAPPATEQQDAQSNGFITDRTDLSAKALALSKSVPPAGSSSEQGEVKASEQGETQEEPASSVSLQAQYGQQSSRQSSPSINIRV